MAVTQQQWLMTLLVTQKLMDINIVLIDTAGRMQTNQNLMNELVKVKRVVTPDLTVFVVDSLIGNDAVMQAEEFNKGVGIDATILTKVDADVKGGSALSVTYVTKNQSCSLEWDKPTRIWNCLTQKNSSTWF